MEIKNPIDKVAWIHIVDGMLLCARSRGKDLYYLPGGKREPGENDAQALTREIREELSIELVSETICSIGVFDGPADNKPEGTLVRLTCCTADYRGQIQPSAEIEEIAWLDSTSGERLSPAAHIVLDWLIRQGLMPG